MFKVWYWNLKSNWLNFNLCGDYIYSDDDACSAFYLSHRGPDGVDALDDGLEVLDDGLDELDDHDDDDNLLSSLSNHPSSASSFWIISLFPKTSLLTSFSSSFYELNHPPSASSSFFAHFIYQLHDQDCS